MKKEIIVEILLPCKHYSYIYNHDCIYTHPASHNHIGKLNLQCLLHNHMLDLSWKVDRRVCFKALLKNYSVIEEIYSFCGHVRNYLWSKESKEFVACCSLSACDSILALSLSRSNAVFSMWISSGFLCKFCILMKLFLVT